MTAEEKVLSFYPDAQWCYMCRAVHSAPRDPFDETTVYGDGNNEDEAWQDALNRIEEKQP